MTEAPRGDPTEGFCILVGVVMIGAMRAPQAGASGFVTAVVVLPSLFGIAVNIANPLVLNYSNAAVGLFSSRRSPPPCAPARSSPAGGSRACWAPPRPDHIAMTFGLGMNSNGTGLVLAAAA